MRENDSAYSSGSRLARHDAAVQVGQLAGQ